VYKWNTGKKLEVGEINAISEMVKKRG